MLEKLSTYFKGHPIFQSLLKKRRLALANDFCCLTLTADEILIAYAKKIENKLQIQWCEAITYSKLNALQSTLNNLVKKYQLEQVRCVWMLQPNDYQLLQLEALPVAPGEFQEAIRWKIKEMLPFSVNDAVIDHFPIPIQQSHDPKKMIMVAAAKLSYVNKIADMIAESGLYLDTIDIQGLGLRNITALYEQDEKSTALIYLDNKISQLIITREKTLYLSRYLDVGFDTVLVQDGMNQALDRLGLEIQRSFDYYQGQWRHPVPARILLAGSKGTSDQIAGYLSKRLTMDIQILNLMDVLACQKAMTIDAQGKYLSVIGGLLREEGEYDTAN